MTHSAPTSAHAAAASKSSRIFDHLDAMLGTELRPHDRLPTERALAEQFSVNRLTVRHALQRLEQAGRIYRTRGSGTFMAEPRVAKSLELTSFTDDMIARGLVPGSRVLEAVHEMAGGEIGFELEISPRDFLYRVDRLRTGDDRPMCIERTYFRADIVPELLEHDLSGSIYALLRETYGLVFDHAGQTISATVLTPEQAELLECAPFSPALRVTRSVQDVRGRRVEYGESIYRGDRYSFDFAVYRLADAPKPSANS